MRRLPSDRRRTAAVLCCLVTAVASRPVRGDDVPGPVPLLRDALPAARQTEASGPAAPAGLGDWRLIAALGATFAVLVAVRLASNRRATPLPADVFEVLGTASLGGQHAVRIVRFGPKTLLVGVSAAGSTTLAEIADPQATACIAAACRGIQRASREPRRPAATPVAARPSTGEAA